MRKLFENLLISSPNGGGLFFSHGGEVFCLDALNTTGFFYHRDIVLRGFQPNDLCIYDNPAHLISGASANFNDVHDVLWEGGYCYLVGTAGNEIIKLSRRGDELQRWVFPGDRDSWHINCLGSWRGRIVFSAFGDFREHRGYKGKSLGAGFVQDLLSGERLISGLSQPHSLVAVEDRLFLANSEQRELIEFSADGNILRAKQLDGYARGIFVLENTIYVGLSCSRNIEFEGITSATVVALDLETLEELGRLQIPAKEIYAIQHISDRDDLARVLATIGATSSAMLKESLDKHIAQIASLSQAVTERDGQIASLSQTVTERDGQIASLSQAVTERDGQIASLSQTVTERDGQIASLSQAVTKGDGQIASLSQAVAERDGQITGLSQSVAERDAQLADKDTAWSARLEQTAEGFEAEIARIVSERDVEINRLHSCVLEREARIAQFDRRIADMLSSHSWRITAPLRWASRSVRVITHDVRGIPRNILNGAERLFRALPLPALFRRKFAHFVFASTGSLFADRYSYRRWKESRSVQAAWSPLPVTATATAATALLTQTQQLPVADGSWEWHDYDAVKSRIAQLKAQQLAQVAPVPQQIVDIGDESFESAVARIRLPEVPDEPDVSIILPVFNNLKLTIECLLSISVHAAPGVSFEVLLADDASTDETVEVLSRVKNLRILRNPENLGFLRNCNNALQHVCGRYVLYLNNDVQVTDGWLTSLYETFFTHTNVGAVGSRFVYPSGHLQEAGVAFRHDATADMVGLNDDPAKPRYNYVRRVDYISGACLMLPTALAKQLGGFSEEFLPCYCEDSDLCLRVREAGYDIYYNPASTIIHHLSKTTAAFDSEFKLKSIAANLVKLQKKWADRLDASVVPKTIAFYLPQFHPFPENNLWWGEGFTEWTNVTKAQPNFVGHYHPRLPADLGFYDLRLIEVMEQQAALARRYGVHGFCFYYYWFGGKRLLERPIEQMLASGKPAMPFCLCWANENWSRRWDGLDSEILMAQSHSEEDDEAVILDLIRYFRDPRYIRVDGRPMILVYRVTLFPDFAATAARWRKVCREQGIGEIYIAMVESMALVHANRHPGEFGCDAAVEFPPLEMADQKPPSGEIINPEFAGAVADYRDIAVRYAVRDFPGYTRFKGVMPGWDNTARRQNNSFCFEHSTPGAFQAWLEETFEQTRQQHYGDERLVFINAWNEWAEGAYLEPDRRFGHTYLEALKNATEAARLLRRNKYWHGN